MFKNLYTYLNDQEDTEFINRFFEHLEDFAFYDELISYLGFETIDINKKDNRIQIIKTLLNQDMNYGSLPKALIQFHHYDDCITTLTIADDFYRQCGSFYHSMVSGE